MTYEFALKPTRQQVEMLNRWLEICRKVYNFALRERKDWVNSRKCPVNACSLTQEYIVPPEIIRPTYHTQAKALTVAKQSISELGEPQIHVLQQTLIQLEKAFVAMWERGHGFPRFKKFGRMRSFVYPQLGINPVQGSRIKLPKIGWVKMRLSRPILDGFKLKQVRIVKKASGWFAMLSLAMDVDVPQIQPHGEPLGIDLGLTSFAATSSGELIPRPRFFVDAQRKLKSLQRAVSRKVKGSNNRKKAQGKVARFHQHIHDTRKDFHFKLARYLVTQAGMVFVEDLNLKAMSRGMLCKHTLDAGWGQFLNILEWVAFKSGAYFQRINPNGTSQTCPQCQTQTGKKELSERVHECFVCGYKTNRDVAAAQVVLQRGIVAVGHTVLKLGEATS